MTIRAAQTPLERQQSMFMGSMLEFLSDSHISPEEMSVLIAHGKSELADLYAADARTLLDIVQERYPNQEAKAEEFQRAMQVVLATVSPRQEGQSI